MLRLDINIVWTILNLLIIFAIVKIFLIKPIHKILDARQAEIDKQYADAKAAQDSAEELKTKYEASLSGVQAEKEGILNEARGKASNEYDRIVADAQTEAKRFWTMPIKMPHWKSRSVFSRHRSRSQVW